MKRDDPELVELARLVRERNAVDARIAQLLDRPAGVGHIGEWLAARVFDIELEQSAATAGYDGRFTGAPLSGKTVNVKAYGKHESVLDINPHAPVDYYLVFAGPRVAAMSSRGTTRPFCIDRVFLIDAHRLHAELEERGVKIGVATSVRAALWDAAEIFPRATNPLLAVTDWQRRQLELFTPDT